MSSQRHPQGIKAKYNFIKAHQNEFSVVTQCRVLEVSRSGYYEWLRHPLSGRDQENRRLLALMRTQLRPPVIR